MRFFSDFIKFKDETQFLVKLFSDFFGVYLQAEYKKKAWKKERNLFRLKLPPHYLYKLYYVIGQEMNNQNKNHSCPVPYNENTSLDSTLKYYSLFREILPKFIKKLDCYINNNYIIKFDLNIIDQKSFDIKKEDLNLIIKFDWKEIHDDILSYDILIDDISPSLTIKIEKLDSIIENINYKKIHNYCYENILNKQNYKNEDFDFIHDAWFDYKKSRAKYNFNDNPYINSYQQAFNYILDFFYEYSHDEYFCNTVLPSIYDWENYFFKFHDFVINSLCNNNESIIF